jgi:hypothetical protein
MVSGTVTPGEKFPASGWAANFAGLAVESGCTEVRCMPHRDWLPPTSHARFRQGKPLVTERTQMQPFGEKSTQKSAYNGCAAFHNPH